MSNTPPTKRQYAVTVVLSLLAILVFMFIRSNSLDTGLVYRGF